MKKFSFGLLLLFSSFLNAQSLQGVSPETEKKIKESINKEALDLKERLEKKSENEIQIEFTIDTFKIEREMEEYIKIDYSTYGMKEAVMIATEKYDSILNKYYKKLLTTLKKEDKKILIKAQKAWLTFRDSETDLIEKVSDDIYTGGGTMQGLVNLDEYMALTKNRTIAIFNHYTRATQNDD
jgi:uncharacterized protein YecT (DUF1311 family)